MAQKLNVMQRKEMRKSNRKMMRQYAAEEEAEEKEKRSVVKQIYMVAKDYAYDDRRF